MRRTLRNQLQLQVDSEFGKRFPTLSFACPEPTAKGSKESGESFSLEFCIAGNNSFEMSWTAVMNNHSPNLKIH
jgi:hypothetical protein